MAKRVSAADAKARFSSLLDEMVVSGQRTVIERQGRAVAALVSLADLKRLEELAPRGDSQRGSSATAGAWRDSVDEGTATFVRGAPVQRTHAPDARVEIEE